MTLTRYVRRFGGEGTVVTLADGRAVTAAHCIASIDGRRGALIAAPDGCAWRVVRRWSPAGRDLALLVATPPLSRGVRVAWPGRAVVRPGLAVWVAAWTGRRFTRRRAVIRTVSRHAFVADLVGRAGVRAGDSGGAVMSGGVLVGVVTHRTGVALSALASASVRVARVDTREVRAVAARRGLTG